jgi:hypothetical protein
VHPVEPAERVDRQLLQHPVAGQVGHDAGDLVRGQPTGDPGELRDEPGHGPRAVHQPGQRQLFRGQSEITRIGTVGRTKHHIVHTADAGERGVLDARAQAGPGPRGVEPFGDGGPQSGVGGGDRLAGGATGQDLPHAQPGLDDRHWPHLAAVFSARSPGRVCRVKQTTGDEERTVG